VEVSLGLDTLQCPDCGHSIFIGPPGDPCNLKAKLRQHKCLSKMTEAEFRAEMVRRGFYNSPPFSQPKPAPLGTVPVSRVKPGDQFLHLGKVFMKCVSIKGRQLAIELLDGKNNRWYTGEIFSFDPGMMVEA